MEISTIWRAIKSRWLWVVCCVLIAIVLTAGFSIVNGVKYAAQSELLVTAAGGGFGTTSESVYNAERLSASRAPTYAQLIQNREVLTRTAIRTRGGVTADDIASALTVTTTREIPIVQISIADRDPRRAADIARNLGLVFSDYVRELESSDSLDVRVAPVTPNPEVVVDGSLTNRLVLAAVFGLLFGVFAVSLAERLDTRIQTGRELQGIGAAYLGTVPVDPTRADSWQEEDASGAYRKLAAAVVTNAGPSGCSRFLITSAAEATTASTVAHGLAAYLAETGELTLLVNARWDPAETPGDDLRPGLSELVESGSRVGDFARYGRVQNLAELSVGMHPERLESLLIGHDFAALAADLDATFNFVVIDAPAATESPTGVAVAPLARGAVIVAESGNSRRAEVDDLTSALNGLHVPVIGVVLAKTSKSVDDDNEPAPSEQAHGAVV